MSGKTFVGIGILICWGLLQACAQTAKDTEPPKPRADSKPVAFKASEPPLLPAPSLPPLQLKAGYPERYTVQLGDTIWTIAALYLDNPWRWRELWPQAPADKDSELYPGDTIVVAFVQDRPVLQLLEGQRGTIKLSPQVRVEYINQKVPPITRDAIQAFVDDSVVVSEADWKGSPYVVGSADGRNTMQSGTVIFARGSEFDHTQYRVYRPEGELRDPDSNAFLGFSLIYVGDAILDEEGDPARLELISSRQPVRAGDRLLPARDFEKSVFSFDPIAAPPDSNGQIIKIPDGALGAPRFATVIVNLGDLDGMKPGSVLEVLTAGSVAKDPLTGEIVELPGERAGLVVLYSVFDRVSYGMVTHAQRPIRVANPVREPS